MAIRLLFLTTIIFFLNILPVYNQNIKPVFTDVAQETGIDFRYTFGDLTYENILESSGSGVTVLDYDGDGDMDLYMLNGTYLEGISDPEGEKFRNTPNELYRNNGNGTFTEVGKKAGIDDRHWSMAAGALDYDNDGDTDIYLLNYGPNVFYRNNGDGTFSEITDQLNLRGSEKLNGFTKWSVGVAFWDYNMDGAVDLMVGNFLAFDPAYVSSTFPDMMPHPSEYKGQASTLYRQESDGSFTEVTKEMGFYYPDSKCMGLTVFDYDDDGDLDLFQGNDHQANFLFRNDGNGTFKEVAVASGVAVNNQGQPTGSMHGSIGDIDGDGLIDLLVTDLKHGALYRNLGNGVFEDITESSGVSYAFAGKGEWAASFFDYDNDGDLDIFSANGTAEELKLQLPLLLENNGKGYFKNVGKDRGAYFKEKRSGRGGAVWDYDDDGDLDIIVSHVDLKTTAALLKNEGGNQNHWLGITLQGKNGPASAIGAKVSVEAGALKQVLVNQWATSYLSYNDSRLHIGLGKEKKVDKLIILWPDGTKETHEDVKADQYITIVQGKSISEQ
ncbi:MAG: CRTAC1 family protein [Bacteroidetes bacterium]|nr:CRTAC1 family protein [Bacteroidota bacterium]